MGPIRTPKALLCLLVASLLAGCASQGNAAASPDAHARFVQAVDRAMNLQTIHVTGHLDLQGAVLGAVSGSTFDADIDFGQGELRAAGGMLVGSASRIELVVADGVWYRRDGVGWARQGGGMIPMPPGDDIRSALSSFATDDRLVVTSTDASCAGTPCHQLVATASPELVWDRFAGVLRALVYLPDERPADLAPVTVRIDADTATSDPVHIEISTTLGGIPAKLVVDGSAIDVPLDISAPVD